MPGNAGCNGEFNFNLNLNFLYSEYFSHILWHAFLRTRENLGITVGWIDKSLSLVSVTMMGPNPPHANCFEVEYWCNIN
jgi:hypothetical protein